MKTSALVTTVVLGALCQFAPQFARAQNMNSTAPVVVKTVPGNGTKAVPSGEFEICVTFSQEMTDHSWSFCSARDKSTMEFIGKPNFGADHKTCVVKVKLEPGRTYGCWINNDTFQNFRNKQGQSAVPCLLTFQTKK